jgi:hypothetical protein
MIGGGMRSSSPYCAGMVIENINRDGVASVVYFHGLNAEFRIYYPGSIRWVGRMTNRGLRLPGGFEVGGGIFLKVKSPTELAGLNGITDGNFNRQR